jgi:glycosyltransferase involved in cell wall biosynthesis
MNVFLWHVHGSWTTALVQGPHRYFLPVTPERGPDGRGRARTWEWPESVEEVDRATAADLGVDVVIMQRPEELDHLTSEWLAGRRPGRDIPAVYLEHNAPSDPTGVSRHHAAGAEGVTIVHVTHFNALMWNCGSSPTRVIEHGIVDPGEHYTGELPRIAVVINEARRRSRVSGTDLLDRFASAAPVDLFGMDASSLGGTDDLPQHALHGAMSRRRVYVHPYRWTSLGLSLLEAMHLGMPVVALATTDAVEAVPREAGVISTDVDRLVAAVRCFVNDRGAAVDAGRQARSYALARYGLPRFLGQWDELLEEVVS